MTFKSSHVAGGDIWDCALGRVEKSKNGVESYGYCFLNVFWYVENGGNFFFGHREYFDKWNFT